MRRALAGQFLVVSLVVPIVYCCGPDDWERNDNLNLEISKAERANTVRHMIQMEGIIEEDEDEEEEEEEEDDIDDEAAAFFAMKTFHRR